MTKITLHNTATRRKAPFTPIDDRNVRMYVCGPTVYDRAHLGNARPVVVFDVLFRLLRHVYGADHVTYVRNFTDVDDKINATAKARKEAGAVGSLEDLIRARSDETIAWYLEDMAALGTLAPSKMPRATEWIAQMITMTQGLIDQGNAYEAEGHVLFRVRSYEDYGALSGRSVDDMIAGARVEVAPYKKTHWISFCGSRRTQTRPDGIALGVAGVRAGILNVRQWRTSCWAGLSTSTAAAMTCNSRTTKTK